MDYFESFDAEQCAATLERDGVVVIPVLTPAALNEEHDNFEYELRRFPEYKRDPFNVTSSPPTTAYDGRALPAQPLRYVGGGFGALANPGSIHNPSMRALRWRLHEHILPLLAATRPNKAHKVHVVVDRMRVLRPDASISAETWHRDTTPAEFTLSDDVIFGGWINLDRTRPQRFHALLGSHRQAPIPVSGTDAGFSKFDEATQAALNAHRATLPVERWQVAIPPGHLMIFYQELIHEVAPRNGTSSAAKIAATPAEYRLFTSWRLTRSNQPLTPCLPNDFFTAMSMPRLKSNQIMPMYPQDGYIRGTRQSALNFADWSVRSFPEALLKSWLRANKNATPSGNDALRIVLREMPNLVEVCRRLGVDVPYPPYSEDEKRIYYPHDSCVSMEGNRLVLEEVDDDAMDIGSTCTQCQSFGDYICLCHNVVYCSKECQNEHWGVHQSECVKR